MLYFLIYLVIGHIVTVGLLHVLRDRDGDTDHFVIVSTLVWPPVLGAVVTVLIIDHFEN